MKFYLTVIGVAMLIISAVNIIFDTAAWYNIIILVVVCTALQFALNGIIAIIINKMPDKLFGVDSPLYNVSEAEKTFYRKLKVRSWKDKVWELGGLGGFRKNKLNDPNNPEYIERFIIECNKGVVTHRIGYFVGFLGVFLFPLKYALVIGIPVALVNLFLNILPTMVLRYNTPKLQVVLKRLKRTQTQKEKDII